jgi:DNA-damage-inducible protein J
LTISDAVRILLTRVAEEGGLPPGLTAAPEQYDQWFKAKVLESLNAPGPGIPLDEAMKRLATKIR